MNEPVTVIFLVPNDHPEKQAAVRAEAAWVKLASPPLGLLGCILTHPSSCSQADPDLHPECGFSPPQSVKEGALGVLGLGRGKLLFLTDIILYIRVHGQMCSDRIGVLSVTFGANVHHFFVIGLFRTSLLAFWNTLLAPHTPLAIAPQDSVIPCTPVTLYPLTTL